MTGFGKLRRNRLEPTRTYRCISAHVCRYGLVRDGDERLGADPCVTSAPQLFAPVGLTPGEYQQLRYTRGLL